MHLNKLEYSHFLIKMVISKSDKPIIVNIWNLEGKAQNEITC